MDDTKFLNRNLKQVERERHALYERMHELNEFLGEGIANLVNSTKGQLRYLQNRYEHLSDREEALRHRLAEIFGPDYKCTCAEYEHTGECQHKYTREVPIKEPS